MSKANQFLFKIYELSDTAVQSFSQKSGKSVAEVEKMIKEIEKSLEKSVNKSSNPAKFFGILTNILKSKLDLPGAKGGRTV